jgi:drug/metabolite transporter (DMT)-like permease
MPARRLPKKILLANLAFLVVTFIWAAANPVIKYTLAFFPPYTFLFIRLLLACIILLPYVVIKLTETKINKKDYLNFFLLGLFAQSSIAIIFVALEYTTALDATIISIITGALTVYAGNYFYKEKISKRLQIGMLLTIAGTLVVMAEPLLSNVANHIPIHDRLFGNFLALIYHLTWVIYVIWSKMSSSGEKTRELRKSLDFIRLRPMTKPYSPVLIAVIGMYVGLLTTIPLAIFENLGVFGGTAFNISSVPAKGVMGLLFMTIFSSIAAFTLYQWALDNGRISDSAIFNYLSPVFAFPVSYFLLGELPTAFLITGAVIVTIGVIVAETDVKERLRE